MSENLAPDTSIALLQASQATTGLASSKMKNSQTLAAIEKTAQEFEAVFVSAMMKPMFEGTTDVDGPFGGGKGEEIFQGMMLQEYGKMISKTGSIGLADDVKATLIEMQGLKTEDASSPSRHKNELNKIDLAKNDDADMNDIAQDLNTMIIGE